MIIVILILIGIIYFWIRTSNKPIKTGLPGSSSSKSGNLNSLYTGIYDPAHINQRCSDGTGPNITPNILLPGFSVPPPCAEGFSCVKVNPDTDPYGYCKAKLGSKCNTIYDCAPIGASLGPTGTQLGQTVFCNNVCSNRITGNLLTGCTTNKINNATGTIQFKCDGTQNLVCNNVVKPPDNTCFSKYLSNCNSDEECSGGVCFAPIVDGIKQSSVCYCPSADSNINLQVCVYVDGQRCQYNQECYGGVCQKNGTSDFGICQSRYLPGKPCELGPNGENACIEGYGCAAPHPLLGKICQPLSILGPSGIQAPSETNKVNSLCTDYNVYTSIGPSGPTIPSSLEPLLTCDPGLICNYNLSTRVPVGRPNIDYLKGFGTCQRPLSKIGQSCSSTAACVYPGVCIQDEFGVGTCQRPQFFDENDTLTIYVNNPADDLDASTGFTAYPEIYSGKYNTLMVQLVGGGGGGQYGFAGATGVYGGGGGGSGQVVGYIPAEDYRFGSVGATGIFQYKNTNVDGLYPNPYIIDLESFVWNGITVNAGTGGNGGIAGLAFAQNGFPTILNFYNGSSVVKTVAAQGGNFGNAPFPILTPTTNGSGGAGFNGGGAGSGGSSATPEANGGTADILNGGQIGEFTKGLNNSALYNGNGGGIGGGRGKNPLAPLSFGTSAGGGGGGGSVINYLFNDIKISTGGQGSISSSIKGIPYIEGAGIGIDYTGGGGGGGSLIGTILNDGAKGGKGYAILRFSKVYKDINYVGQENPNVIAPPSGSSGQCTPGFKSNGIYQITGGTGNNGAEFCIPEKYYTCNTYNSNYIDGSLCMNDNNTQATGVCGTNSIGIFIPIPPNIGAKKGSFVSESFGKWHFIDLPNQSDSASTFNVSSSISVFQVPGNDLYPKTRLIYHPFNDTFAETFPSSKFFYYTEFSTKDISPNNPLNQLKISPQWYKVLIQSSSTSNVLNAVCDIKFTTAGNIGMILNETAPIVYPFVPNQNNSAGIPTPYYRIYSSNFSQLTLNTTNSSGILTYTASNLGPNFCYSAGAGIYGDSGSYAFGTLNTMYINDANLFYPGGSIRPYNKFIWDIDDAYNKSVCICFKDRNLVTSKYFIFSSSFTNDVNELSDLNEIPYDGTFGFIGANMVAIPRSLKFYTDTFILPIFKPYKYLWQQRSINDENNEVVIREGNTTSTIRLEETDQEQAITFSFNRVNDLALFDFYYASLNDQFKYITVNLNTSGTVKYNSNELQVPGYLPSIMTQDNYQTIFNFLTMGNLDRSMYAIITTCN